MTWKKSETVFRFGNNATLPSIGAIFLPFGQQWMKLEVVGGNTPFLLSNAFLKAVQADICTSSQELRMLANKIVVPLQMNKKGLLLVDLANILEAIARVSPDVQCEVVTMVQELEKNTHTQSTHTSLTEAKVVRNSNSSEVFKCLSSTKHGTKDDGARCRESSISVGRSHPRPAGRCSPPADEERKPEDCAPARSDIYAGVGIDGPRRWKTSREDFPAGSECRSELCEVHAGQDRLHLPMGTQLPQFHDGQGEDRDREPPESDASDSTSIPEGLNKSLSESRSGNSVCISGMGCHRSRKPGDFDIHSRSWSKEGDGRGRSRDTADEPGSGSQQSGVASGPDRDPPERLGSDDPQLSGVEKTSNSKVGGMALLSSSEELGKNRTEDTLENELTQELARVSAMIQKDLDELAAMTSTCPKSRIRPSVRQLDLLEVFCEENSHLTKTATWHGLNAKRFTMNDGDLRTPAGRTALWQIVERERPKHIWVAPDCKWWGNFARFNMFRGQQTQAKILQGRKDEKEVMTLCNDLYWHQVTHNRHFHMEQPQGSELLDQRELEDVRLGTLVTTFDMCEVGALKIGNNFLRKRTTVNTTSRTLHESLDCRYCRKNHAHRQIKGQVKYFGRWISVSAFAARYSLGFSRNIVGFLRGEFEGPMGLEELCFGEDLDQERVQAAEVLKRRRLHEKQTVSSHGTEVPTLGHKTRHQERWEEVFKKLNDITPRVGARVIEAESKLFDLIRGLCPKIEPIHIEACRGTERLKVPKAGTNLERLELRQTVSLHRETGKIQELGPPERWKELSQRQKVRKGVPTRLGLTVFGCVPERASSSGRQAQPPEGGVSTSSKVDERKRGRETETTEGDGEEKKARKEEDDEEELVGGPPRNVARSGPRFLELGAEDRKWLKSLHHRLGHPDADKFARYLKSVHAEGRFVAAALDYQCDTCSESRKGFDSARPSAIHEDIGFNHTVGVDVAHWTNSVGTVFKFVHFLDEGTLFHVARPCQEDAIAQLTTFEDFWISWAGAPSVVYVDPAREYLSEAWNAKMQEEGVELRVTAADSHWQLGRVEAHGATLKDMLTRIDIVRPVGDHDMFRKALVQACTAKNTLSRINGYTPEQAVLGFARKLPASVTSDGDAVSHARALDDGPSSAAFRAALELRTSARKAFISADNSSSLRRALLRRSRPVRHQFERGDLVLYWKRKGGNLRRERGAWFGPARVMLVEGRNVVWLVHGHRLIRASPEQLRAASMREWKAVKDTLEIQTPVQDWAKKAGHQDFWDLGEEIPDSEPVEIEGEGGSEAVESLGEPEREVSGENEVPRDGVDVPVPEEDDEDIFFGDVLEPLPGNHEVVWEMDVTPENLMAAFEWKPGEANDFVLMATEDRKKRVEVKLRDLCAEDQKRFAVAKHKELGAWLSHKTVRRVSQGRIPEHAIMRCRWLLTWKTPNGDEKPADIATNGKKAKARLIVIGWEDPQLSEVTSDAPTLSKDGRQVVLQQIASHRWQLVSFDVSTAFLHGKGDGRTLGLHPVPELRDALEMGESDQIYLDGGAYGRIDAPFLWFCEFRDELINQGCKQCPLDPCVFSLYSKDATGRDVLEGCLGIHVDDGVAGGSQKFMDMLKRVEARFKFGSFEKGEFVYTGIRFRQWDDGSIEYDQIPYIEKISPICLDKGRKEDVDSPLSESERTKFRSLIGALQYAAVHTRPDIAAKIGELQSLVSRARIADVIQANKVLQEAKQNKVSLMVLPIAPELVTFCAFSDASFSSVKHTTAHQGTIVFVTTPELFQNQRAVVAPIAWASKKIPRVVRSTLGAEAASLSNSLDRLMWIRVLWHWILDPKCAWYEPETLLKETNRAGLVTDCKSAYDLLTRTAIPQCTEHRTTIECLLMRERMKENCCVRWVSSQAMLADGLTKSMDSAVLRACLETGRYSLRDEDGVLKERADKKQRVQWIKQQNCMHVDCDSEKAQSTFVNSRKVDFWKVGPENELCRVHVVPRLQRYTPIGSVDCPWDLREFSTERVTVRKGCGEERDHWVGTLANMKYSQPWIGETRFFKEDSKKEC